MPEFSLEFWLASVVAFIALLVGIAVTVAMDTRTKGELRLAVTCFAISAMIVSYGIVVFDMTTKWSAMPRVMAVYGVAALTVLLTGEAIRWTKARHERAISVEAKPEPKPQSQPLPTQQAIQPPRRILQALTLNPPAGEIKLQFKASPFFNHKTRGRITHDITRFRDYFVRLGIPVPMEVPPISLAPGENTSGISTPPGLPTYRGTVQIGKKQVSKPSAATGAYCGYAINRIFWDTDSPFQPWYGDMPNPNINALGGMMILEQGLSGYFNSSFWNEQLQPPMMPWAYRLWRIREKFGRDFTDRLVAVALRSMIDNPNEGRDKPMDFSFIDVYFARKLKIGDSVIDDGMSRWPEILNILKEEKVPVEQI